MINNTQYVSHSFTFPGARMHAHALTHTPLPAGRAMQRPTYPISIFLSPQWGGGIIQPWRNHFRVSTRDHTTGIDKVLICFTKETLLDGQRSSFGWLGETAKAWKILKHGMLVTYRNELRLALPPRISVRSVTSFSAPPQFRFILWCSQYVKLYCIVSMVRLLAHYEFCTASVVPPICNSPLQI